MTTPGRLHLIATLALVLCFAGATLAQAGIFQTPAGGWGVDRPAPPPAPTGGEFGTTAGGSPNS
jgi:hypothetical protein